MKRLLVSFFTVLVSIAILAGNVTEQQALTIARQFMQGKTFQQKQVRRAATVGDNQFYVFNAENKGGFVIVSADDRTIPVLGYADKGSLEMDKLPVNARRWLEGYAAQIKSLGTDETIKYEPRRALGTPVAPLLTCQWGQNEPYNHRCNFYGGYCVTGCVATAMAQVMYYHQWPKAPTPAIPSYMTGHKLRVDELPSTVFKWDKMKDTYIAAETGEAADAVAELMRYCGQAVEMDYRLDLSSAIIYASVMTYYFGYSKTARDIVRATYSTSEWEKIIYNEVASKRPVLYSGFSEDGGHQFVIDGYDDKGLFHVNWGWNGNCDGFFSLSILNPYGRGTGGGSSSNGYTMNQTAVIGLQPDHGEDLSVPVVYYESSLYEPQEYTRTSSTEDFTGVSANGRVYSLGIGEVNFDHAWMLYKDGVKIQELEVKRDLKINEGNYQYYHLGPDISSSLTFGAGLADGIYELRQMVSKPGADQWDFCQSSDRERSLLLAEISGNKLTVKDAEYLEREGAIKVNNVTINGVKKANRPLTAVVNLTNNGYMNETPLYINLEGSDVGAASSFLGHGETGEVEIVFIPKYDGTQTLKLSIDKKQSNVIYEQEITIEQSLPQNLTATITVEGEVNGAVQGTTLHATATFTNEGTNAYNDNIEFYLFKEDRDNNFEGDPVTVVKPLSLAAGAQGNITVEFTNLAPSEYYLVAEFYGPGLTYAATKSCVVGLEPHQLDATLTIEGETAQTIEGTTINATAHFRNMGSNDYDDDIVFTLYLWNEQGDNLEGAPIDITKPLKLAAGAQGDVSAQFPDLIAGRQYLVVVSYYGPSRKSCTSTTCTVGKTVVVQNLNISANVQDSKGTDSNEYQIVEGTAKLTITVRNNGENNYNDKLNIYIYSIDEQNNIQWLKTQQLNVEVAAGETKVIKDYELTGLTVGTAYTAWIYYYSGDTDQWGGSVPSFILKEATTPEPGPQASPADEVSLMLTSMNTKEVGSWDIEGTTAKMDIMLRNSGTSTHNFRLDVVTYQINTDYTRTEVKTQYINVEIAAGETQQIRNHEIPGLVIGKSYKVEFYYFTPMYDSQYVDMTPQFNMVEATGINTIVTDKPVDIYNLHGSKVRSKATSTDGLPKGIYIINGQKYTVK